MRRQTISVPFTRYTRNDIYGRIGAKIIKHPRKMDYKIYRDELVRKYKIKHSKKVAKRMADIYFLRKGWGYPMRKIAIAEGISLCYAWELFQKATWEY